MTDTDYLLLCLQAAKQRQGFTGANPAVGAVLVYQNKVLASGCHFQAGFPHAEPVALHGFSARILEQSTLYVTLEPCSHQGRTPACADFIVAKKLQRVVFAHLDPNPLVAGKGMAKIQAAGIACVHQPVAAIDDFYRAYDFANQHQRPFTYLKIARSELGYIAAKGGLPVALTNEAQNQLTHSMRLQSNALLTSAATVLNDQPVFTARGQHKNIPKPLYVLDQKQQLTGSENIFQVDRPVTIFYDQTLAAPRSVGNQRYVPMPLCHGRLDLQAVWSYLSMQDGVQQLWVEVGATLFAALIEQQLASEVWVYETDHQLDAGVYCALPQHAGYAELPHKNKALGLRIWQLT